MNVFITDKENHSQGDLREIHNTGNEVQSTNQNPNIFGSMPNEATDVKGTHILDYCFLYMYVRSYVCTYVSLAAVQSNEHLFKLTSSISFIRNDVKNQK